MRPLELTMEGFKSYRESCTFEFEGRSLFGIVGPTGAGKSSILEALLFGFYGKTPRVERDTKKLINSGETEARVHLVFEVDERAWSVTRVIRRKGASQVLLASLDGKAGQITGDKAVNEAVTDLLGLDFNAFCASITLPQGDFDRFLKAGPKQRTEILKGLFRLQRVDQLREKAKSRLQLIEVDREVAGRQLQALPAEPERLLQELRGSLAAATETFVKLEATVPVVTQAERDLYTSAARLDSLKTRKREYLDALSQLPPEDLVDQLVNGEAEAHEALKDAEAKLAEASARLKAGVAGQQILEQQGVTAAWCARLDKSLADKVRLTHEVALVEKQIAEPAAALRALNEQVAGGESKVRESKDEQARAQEYFEALSHEHAAHSLRSDLSEGDSCPVCLQPISELPGEMPLPELAEAKAKVKQAEKNYEQSVGLLGSWRQQQALAGDRRLQAEQSRERLLASLSAVDSELGILVAPPGDPAVRLKEARKAIEASALLVSQALAFEKIAAFREREAARNLVDRERSRTQIGSTVSHVAGRLGVSPDVIEDQGLASATKLAAEAGRLLTEQLERDEEALAVQAEDSRRTIASFQKNFQAGPTELVHDVFAREKLKVENLSSKIDEIEESVVRRRELETEATALTEQADIYKRLTSDLTDSKFTAFLLEEQRRQLSALASEKLLELTGHYVFSEDGAFEVVDQRTDSTRTPDTLSGGETFLASLSLALALAELVAQRGGRLGCFFLDEGFGSLDAESLDRALEGIEELAVPGRLIGLISHVGGIQSRLDDLIILERGSDGTTSVSQHQGPIGFAPAVI